MCAAEFRDGDGPFDQEALLEQVGAEGTGQEAARDGGSAEFAGDLHGDVGDDGFGDLAPFVKEQDVVVAGARSFCDFIDGAVGGLVIEEWV